MFKYIMFQDKLGAKQPVLFSKAISHITIAESLSNNAELNLKPVSAGFCGMASVICCYGESETMKMKSDPQDSVVFSTHPWCFGLFDEMSENVMRLLTGESNVNHS